MDSEPYEITIRIEPGKLSQESDARLATLWHLTQANPAPFGDPIAGRMAAKVGDEIIRRWLAAARPDLWKHKGSDYYWDQLRRLARYEAGEGPTGSLDWYRGRWVPRVAEDVEAGPVASEEG